MKKNIFMVIIFILVALFIIKNGFYPQSGRITRIDNNIIEITTFGGNVWEIEQDPEDYAKDDIVSMIMYKGITTSIYDDRIVMMQYSGR